MTKQYKDYSNYLIYQDGNIFSKTKNKFLIPVDNGRGYKKVNLCKNGSIKRIYVHRLIAETFLPNPENKPQVNHINGIKSDNRLENLEWVTPSENGKHAFKIGLNKSYNKNATNNPNYRHGKKTVINKKSFCLYCKKEFIAKYINSVCCSKSCHCNYTMNTKKTY
jgi:hypothetical protein